MKEIYRSFDGKLEPENQAGYIVYRGKNFYEVENISVWNDQPNGRFRIKKELNWKDITEISEACFRVENGTLEGQAFWHGKWYKTKTINNIQKKRKDYNWRRYV